MFHRNQEYYNNKLSDNGFFYQVSKIFKTTKKEGFLGDMCVYVASRSTGKAREIQKRIDELSFNVNFIDFSEF